MRTDPYTRRVWAWAFYDWANSAFACTVMAAMLPPYFAALVGKAGYDPARGTQIWGLTSSAALLIVAAAGPVLGAIADHTGWRKRFLAAFLGVGVLGTALLATLTPALWWLAPVWYGLGFIGFGGGNVFYESLLPHVAREDDLDRVSSLGYALGYAGGGLLLAINVLWFQKPQWFGLPGPSAGVRLSFVSVAVWWAVFSLPMFLLVREPAAAPRAGDPLSAVQAGFRRLGRTFRHIRRYRQLALFLAAFWIYDDGIGTIIKMAAIYGSEIGIGMGDLIKAFLVTQFIGFPCAWGFGRLAGRIGAKRAVMLGLGWYALICVGGFFMRTPAHFFLLAAMVGVVQGGVQALSRSLFGAMTPRHLATEFFGFFSTSSKIAGIAGPLVIAVVSAVAGSSRLGIVLLIVFFVAGAALLALVDVEEGRRLARTEEAAWTGR
ncbi:MAG: MFS transporter [Candidatus Sumerlaeia bacterium]